MRKYIRIGIAIIITLFILTFINQYNSLQKYKGLYDRERQNVEAYQMENSALESQAREYKMTIDELRDSNDSLDQKLLAVMDDLKIAEDKVQYLQYHQTQIVRVDTVEMHDTIFRENTDIDTIIGDTWFNVRLQLMFPSTIITTPTCNSEQYVYIYEKQEYNKKRSKVCFIRWFQKKHTVTEVKVEEKNPYIRIVKQKYIKID